MTRLCFLDTETTGLSLDDDVWEFAAIVREPNGDEWMYHLFIEHDTARCGALPEPFLSDHQVRFPSARTGACGAHPDVKSREDAAREIARILSGRPHIVGAVPNFDTERIARLLRRFGLEPDWHYHLIDVEAMAVGYMHGRSQAEGMRAFWSLPWKSDELSRALGVEPDAYARHTALGDVEWARAQYDAITEETR